MKKLLLITAIVLPFLFISCEKEQRFNIDLMMSPADDQREYAYIWGQNENLDIKFTLMADISGMSNVRIKTIDVYLRDSLITTSSGGTEVAISCPLKNVPQGIAVLKTITKCVDDGNSREVVLTMPFYLWITDVKPSTSASLNCPSTVSNGSVLNCTFDYSCNIEEATLNCTKLYLDGKEVAISTSAPYDIAYKIGGLSAGAHEVYGVVYWTKKGSHMFSMPCVTAVKNITVK